jgi:hypothetical protein
LRDPASAKPRRVLEASLDAVVEDVTFELRLEEKRLRATPVAAIHFFTESLILAQDERWRRA